MSKAAPPYKMSLSLSVLRDLGIGLYSNIPAVLSEIVANAWDADANVVDIDMDTEKDEIVVMDDGCGMDVLDINDKYLKVGYRRREKGSPVTPKGRHVMGRKGIGKLSVFSIAGIVEVYSCKKGRLCAFQMDRKKIEDIIKDGKDRPYHPDPISTANVALDKGTKIVLRGLKRELSWSESFLRKRLARRFSVIDDTHNFKVRIKGEELSAKDRDYYGKLEFVWHFGNKFESAIADKCRNLKKPPFRLDNLVYEEPTETGGTQEYRVAGWLGTVDERKSIEASSNTIVIFAHGKLIHEDILKDLPEGGIYSKYLIGEVDADFMDLDEKDDIVTSNRQSVKEDDLRYMKLSDFIWKVLKEIQNRWTELRSEIGVNRALEIEVINEWYGRLRGDHKKYAEKLFGKIESLRMPDIESKKELYKASLLAFERMALQNTLSTIDAMDSDGDFALVMRAFGNYDELEAAYYYQIAKGRVDIIKKFEKMLPKSKERAVQKFIFNHLWLLDASWDRAATDKRMEEQVKKEFKKIDANLSREEKAGRVDIRYRTAAGKHVIIELKKYDRPSVSVYDLAKQIQKYVGALDKFLKKKYTEKSHHIEAICVVGARPTGADDQTVENTLKVNRARYITYDDLIEKARRNYDEYLAAESKISALTEIINRIDKASFA